MAPFFSEGATVALRDDRDLARSLRAGFSQDDIKVRLYTPAASKPVKLLFMADTHLFRDDERGVSFRDVGFGCGHPGWNAAADRNFEIERRPKWRAEGHTRVTMDFHREVFAAPNLLGVFAGHTHQTSVDVLGGIPQVVTAANATGAHLVVEVLPAPM